MMKARTKVKRTKNRPAKSTAPIDVGLRIEGQEFSFVASLSPTSGPVKMDWEGAFRLSFDVPQSERTQMFKLMCLTETAFDVVLHPRMGALPTDSGDGDRRNDDERDGPRGDLGFGEEPA